MTGGITLGPELSMLDSKVQSKTKVMMELGATAETLHYYRTTAYAPRKRKVPIISGNKWKITIDRTVLYVRDMWQEIVISDVVVQI